MKPIYIKMPCLVCLLLLAAKKDITSYKVSNHLIMTGLFLGFLFNFCESGWTGLSGSIRGIIIPLMLLFPLFLIKALGAGDIKLFSVIGCFYGCGYVLRSMAAAFMAAAVLSIAHLIKYKNLFYCIHRLAAYIRIIKAKGSTKEKLPVYYDIKTEGYEGVIHFSVAILISVLIQLLPIQI